MSLLRFEVTAYVLAEIAVDAAVGALADRAPTFGTGGLSIPPPWLLIGLYLVPVDGHVGSPFYVDINFRLRR